MAESKIDLRERTKSFELRIVRMFSTLPKTAEAQVLGRQVLRSGPSSCWWRRISFPPGSSRLSVTKSTN
jgi:hypothetical protein